MAFQSQFKLFKDSTLLPSDILDVCKNRCQVQWFSFLLCMILHLCWAWSGALRSSGLLKGQSRHRRAHWSYKGRERQVANRALERNEGWKGGDRND